jgi:hypothetical protein
LLAPTAAPAAAATSVTPATDAVEPREVGLIAASVEPVGASQRPPQTICDLWLAKRASSKAG